MTTFVEELRKRDMLYVGPLGGSGMFAGDYDESCREQQPVAYMDDAVVLLRSDVPSDLIDQVKEAASLACLTARGLALNINFLAGKTECLLSLKREGAGGLS